MTHSPLSSITRTFALAYVALAIGTLPAAQSESVPLWPGEVPGETVKLPPEADQNIPPVALVAGRPIIRLGNVSIPTMTIFSPDAAHSTGTAVVVCPGGGYSILAMDLEGTEVCEWLNSIGVTAVLLKYRVPARAGLPRHAPPLQDAQRALGLLRSRADELKLDPKRIGILGFSAGAHLAAMLSNHHATRTYPTMDSADDVSCRPDFAILVYPGMLVPKERPTELSADIQIMEGVTPPTFLAMAQDDPVGVENPLFYYLALKQANVAAEMHLYPKGGHGYGLRRTQDDVTTWPDRVTDWMKAAGWLNPPGSAENSK